MTRRSWAQGRRRRIGVAAVIVGLVLALVPASAEARTRVIDLGTLRGGTSSAAVAISDTGFVTGSSTRPGTDDTRGFVWHRLLGMHDLGTLGGGHTRVTAVNRLGYVTGCSDSKDGVSHPFLWSPFSRRMRQLGNLSPHGSGCGGAINDVGQVAGSAAVGPDGAVHAFFWSRRTGMRDLGTFGGRESRGMAMNARGMVVGDADRPDHYQHAFVWTLGTGMRDLGTLGGYASRAFAVSDNGLVTGWSDIPNYRPHAFLWSGATGMRDLGALGKNAESFGLAVSATGSVGGECRSDVDPVVPCVSVSGGVMRNIGPAGGAGFVSAMNRRGQAVGVYYTTPDGQGSRHPFRWSPGRGRRDLGTLGGLSGIPQAINARGTVAGASMTAAGEWHATVWLP